MEPFQASSPVNACLSVTYQKAPSFRVEKFLRPPGNSYEVRKSRNGVIRAHMEPIERLGV